MRALCKLSVYILLVTLTAPLFAQHANPPAAGEPHGKKFKFAPVQRPRPELPPQAGKHRSPELRKKWESLTPEQRKEIWETFKKYVGPEVAKAAERHAKGDLPGPRRLTPGQVDKNKAPKVKASASVMSGRAPLTVTFTAEGRDADGAVTNFQWSFGDRGAKTADKGLASGAVVNHTFDQPGRYLVTVLATDNGGRAAIDHVVIRVDGPNGEPAPAATGVPAVQPPYKPGLRPPAWKVATNSADDDGDGLPEDFERQLADQFTPAYAVSFWEFPWTGMSLFEDRSDMQVPYATFPTYFWSRPRRPATSASRRCAWSRASVTCASTI